MSIGRCLIAILLVSGASTRLVTGQGGATSFDYTASVGVAGTVSQGELCLAIHKPRLTVGTSVVLVWVPIVGERGPSELLLAQTTSKLPNTCGRDSAYQFVAYGDSVYPLKVATGQLDLSAFYFAVLAPREQFHIRGDAVAADLDSAAGATTFRACTSHEGVHLTLWSGEPLKGKRLWHRYVSQGLSVRSTTHSIRREPSWSAA
jgi:hypothetical protein